MHLDQEVRERPLQAGGIGAETGRNRGESAKQSCERLFSAEGAKRTKG